MIDVNVSAYELENKFKVYKNKYGKVVAPFGALIATNRWTFSFGFLAIHENLDAVTKYLLLQPANPNSAQLIDKLRMLRKLVLNNNQSKPADSFYDLVDQSIRQKAYAFQSGAFSEEDFRFYFNNIFYSSLAFQGAQVSQTYGSREGTENFLKEVSKLKSPEGKLVFRYFKDFYDLEFTEALKPEAFRGYAETEMLSVRALKTLFDRINLKLGEEDTRRYVLALEFIQRVDPRMEFSSILDKLKSTYFYDPDIYISHCKENDKYTGYQLSAKIADGEDITGHSIVYHPTISTLWKISLLKQLNAWDEVPEKFQRLFYQRIVDAYPKDPKYLFDYIKYLREKRNYEEGLSLITNKKDKFKDIKDLTFSDIMVHSVNFYLKMKKYNDAELNVELAYKSFTDRGLLAKAKVEFFQSRFDNACKVVEEANNRYYRSPEIIGWQFICASQLKDQKKLDLLIAKLKESRDFRKFVLMGFLGSNLSDLYFHLPNYNFIDLFKVFESEKDLKLFIPVILSSWSKESPDLIVTSLLPKINKSDLAFTQSDVETPSEMYLTGFFEVYRNLSQKEIGLQSIYDQYGVDGVSALVLNNRIEFDEALRLDIFSKLKTDDSPSSKTAILKMTADVLSEFRPSSLRNEILSYFTGNSFYDGLGRFLILGHDESLDKSKATKDQQSLLHFIEAIRFNLSHQPQKYHDSLLKSFFGAGTYEKRWAQSLLKKMVEEKYSYKGQLIVRKRRLEKYQKEGADFNKEISSLDEIISKM